MQRKITDYLKRFLKKRTIQKKKNLILLMRPPLVEWLNHVKNANFMKIVEALLQLLFISLVIKVAIMGSQDLLLP